MQNLFLDPIVHQSLVQLRSSGKKFYIAQSGSCGGLVPALESIPGASKFLAGARFCNDCEDTADFLEMTPEKFVDANVAELLAAKAYWKCLEYARRRGEPNAEVIGVGMTAAIEKDRHSEGTKRVHICIYTPGRVENRYETFWKLSEDASFEVRAMKRAEEAQFCDLFVFNAILSFLGQPVSNKNLQAPLIGTELAPLDQLKVDRSKPCIIARMMNEFPFGYVAWNGHYPPMVRESLGERFPMQRVVECGSQVILVPGSYRPLHHGHIDLARMVSQMTGRTAVFEISVSHPDKVVDEAEIEGWMNQFRGFAPIVVDQAPLYIEKARMYPGVPIAMGADAVLKLLDQKYYGGTLQGLIDVLEEFRRLGTIFYVNGRLDETTGQFVTLSDIPIPARYRDLFREVSMRVDMSSTKLRNAVASSHSTP